MFINARTDVYLRGLAPAAERVEQTLARARLYGAAGADACLAVGVGIGEGLPITAIEEAGQHDVAG